MPVPGANDRPIVIKRVKKVAAGHHGGAWKVAYADFVTAMMAFFMLLWLIANPDKQRLKGLAAYFSPTISDTAPST
ncbi:flagellar motor protein MotB, partial [Escherichia coli]|nr:flagellar motor protein MotB [Escherichia coli]